MKPVTVGVSMFLVAFGGLGILTYLGSKTADENNKIIHARADECNSKDGTYLYHEDLCLDLNHIKLGGNTSSISAVIYGMSSCEPCQEAGAWLQKRHIQYIEKDVSNVAYEDEMRAFLDSQHMEHGLIPVIVIIAGNHTTVLRGFDQWELNKAIEAETIYKDDK
jgi:glutaredoxin